ncbi:MAG: mechanosensitive ion channel [Helicobacteraceae bacterium]|jgi:small-conductance mechanosensitive channel|nr:mechanosensitive ion channel [Helicobacteraceae bacterium]
MSEWLSKLYLYISFPLFNIGNESISLLSLIKFLIVFWLGFYLGRLFRAKIGKLETKSIAPENLIIVSNIGYYVIVIGTVIVGLSALGINLSSLAFVAGAVSVGVGFGLQNIVSNFVSGIILMFEKTVRVGDLIELPTKERGYVKRINMRSTIIITPDNIEIIVPNQTFITHSIVNFSYSDNIYRLKIPFSAAYGSDIERVRSIVLEKINGSDLRFVREKKPNVLLESLGASSLDFSLVVYIKTGLNEVVASYFDFLPLIYDALNAAGISIPFPQADIHIKTQQTLL